VGGGPQSEDVRNYEPLSGQTGKELQSAFDEAGIKRERLFLAYAYACPAVEPRRIKEERAAVLACKPLLMHFLGKLPVTAPVLACGKWAQLALTGREKGLFSQRGFVDMKWKLTPTE
jgi:uracil-DNA glycosylase